MKLMKISYFFNGQYIHYKNLPDEASCKSGSWVPEPDLAKLSKLNLQGIILRNLFLYRMV